jgi:hypothetical protein
MRPNPSSNVPIRWVTHAILACALWTHFQWFKIVPDDFVATLYPSYSWCPLPAFAKDRLHGSDGM